MMIRIACVAAVLIGIGAGDVFACSVPLIRSLHNQTVDGTMSARSGKPCAIRLQYTSGTAESVGIAQRPSHGTVTTSGQSVIYVSRPGYMGPDNFTYTRHGRDKWGNRGAKTIRVAVTVS
jgi:hypothetical protein